jgi:hypothetical protein
VNPVASKLPRRLAVALRFRGEVTSPVLPVKEVGRMPLNVMGLAEKVLRNTVTFLLSPLRVMGVAVKVESVKELKAPGLKVTVVFLREEFVEVRSVPVTVSGKLKIEA